MMTHTSCVTLPVDTSLCLCPPFSPQEVILFKGPSISRPAARCPPRPLCRPPLQTFSSCSLHLQDHYQRRRGGSGGFGPGGGGLTRLLGTGIFFFAVVQRLIKFHWLSWASDGYCYCLVGSGWSLLFPGGLWMLVVAAEWALDHCWQFLMDSGWLLLINHIPQSLHRSENFFQLSNSAFHPHWKGGRGRVGVLDPNGGALDPGGGPPYNFYYSSAQALTKHLKPLKHIRHLGTPYSASASNARLHGRIAQRALCAGPSADCSADTVPSQGKAQTPLLGRNARFHGRNAHLSLVIKSLVAEPNVTDLAGH